MVSAGTVTECSVVSGSLPAALCSDGVFVQTAGNMAQTDGGALRMAFEADHVTVSSHNDLRTAMSGSDIRVALHPLVEAAAPLRAVKDDNEIDAMTRALRLSESVFGDVLSLVKEGVSERDLAAEIDYRQRVAGASRSSFESIVAFGPNSARPHARPGLDRLAPATPILFDFGCEFDGYCSDMTRMVHLGRPSSEFLRIWSLVDAARRAAVESAVSGMSTHALDSTARSVIQAEGYGNHFVHSLGHGLGMDVHEWPGVSARTDHRLQKNTVVTVEPGIYLEGQFGIRLEDTIVITDGDARRLNRLSTEPVIL